MSPRHRTRRQPTSIRLDDRLKATLRAEAQRQRRSVAELIVFILYEYIGRLRSKTPRQPKAKPVELEK